MPKMKTKSSITKRIKVSATGKVKRGQAYRSHLATHKTTKQNRQSRKADVVSTSDLKRWKGLY
ncbi:MAG: 50S ribosomal protein L35 [Mycoplasma sp.]|nr:50S ribosomal protein L35 [Mycoplasma sp.]